MSSQHDREDPSGALVPLWSLRLIRHSYQRDCGVDVWNCGMCEASKGRAWEMTTATVWFLVMVVGSTGVNVIPAPYATQEACERAAEMFHEKSGYTNQFGNCIPGEAVVNPLNPFEKPSKS